jgi:hypothetical protein
MKCGNYLGDYNFLAYTHKDDWTTALDDAAKAIAYGFFATTTAGVVDADPGSYKAFPTVATNVETLGNTVGTVACVINDWSASAFALNTNGVCYGTTLGVTSDLSNKIQRFTAIIDAAGQIDITKVQHTLTIRDISIPLSLLTVNSDCKTLTAAINTGITVKQFHNYGLLIDGSGIPFTSALLQLNGQDRFDAREGEYFNYVQPYQHHSNTPCDGLQAYCFGLKPEGHQPSGTANMSRLEIVQLVLRNSDTTKATGEIDINPFNSASLFYIFAHSYNVLRIMSGMGGLAYAT